MTAPAAQPSRRRLRGIGATVLIVIALLLAPVAAVGTWARVQLVDTDTFVSTFAPLAHDPDVQDFVADQIVDQVNEQVNIPWPSASCSTGSAKPDCLLALRQRSARCERPPSQVSNRWCMASPTSWSGHSSSPGSGRRACASATRGCALLDDDTQFVKLSDDGVVTLRLDPFIDEVKKQLSDHGLTFADRIGHTDRSIPIISSNSLALTRTAVSHAHAPESVANAVFSQVTKMMSSTIAALTVLGVVVAVSAWFHGPARPARAMREVTVAGFDRVRDALDAHDGDTGRRLRRA